MSSLVVNKVTVKRLDPISGADKIVLATFHENEWQVVVGIETKVGDEFVYFPPDTVLPEAIIQKYNLGFVKNGRIRAIKLKGVYSNGLTLPVPADKPQSVTYADYFGATKYVEPDGDISNPRKWPGTVQKYTDIENIRNYPNIFEPDELVIATEKIHGMNFQAGWIPIELPWWKKLFRVWGYKFHVFSRNNAYDMSSDNDWTRIAREYDLERILRKLPGFILSGEIYGKGVQDLTYGLADKKLIIFDIQTPYNEKVRYLDWDVAKELLKSLGFTDADFVPEVYRGAWNFNELEKIASGKTLVGNNPEQMREGIVIRSAEEKWSPKIGRKIVKLISPVYLARKGGTEHK